MVNVIFIGRTCNCLFQYVFGRLLAIKNNLTLVTEWPEEPVTTQFGTVDFNIIKFSPNPRGDHALTGARLRIDDQHRYPTRTDWLLQDFYRYDIEVKGYFQHRAFYDGRLPEIKSWMTLPPIAKGHENDIVIHLRLDDYSAVRQVPIISQSWYKGIVELPENKGKKVYVVASKPRASWETDYVNNLGFNYEFVSESVVHDFHFIRSFGTIICSNSSFAWWAARLSEARKIYTFERWMIGSPFVNLAAAEGMTALPGKYIWE